MSHPTISLVSKTATLTEAKLLQYLVNILTERRTLLLSRVNDQYSATKDLPIEILSIIFRFASQFLEPDIRHKPQSNTFVLAAVSCRWRAVVNATPESWTYLSLQMNENNVVHRAVYLIHQYADKSKTSGVTLVLDFQMYMHDSYGRQVKRMEICRFEARGLHYPDTDGITLEENDNEVLDPVYSAIFDRSKEKIRAIRFLDAPLNWFGHTKSNFCDGFTLLETIYLSWKNHYPKTDHVGTVQIFQLNFTSLPKLQELFICGFPSQYILAADFIVSNTLQHLHLSEIDYNSCITILPHCQSLRTFSMMRPLTPRSNSDDIFTFDPENPIIGGRIRLPNLETFEWTFPDPESLWDYPILDILPLLRLSSICHVTLHQPWVQGSIYAPGLDNFFKRLPNSCRSISLVTNSFHSNPSVKFTIAETLELIPNTISQIELRSSCMGFVNSLYPDICDYTRHLTSEAWLFLNKITRMSVIMEKRHWGNAYGDNCTIARHQYQRCRDPVFTSANFLKAMNKRVDLGLGGRKFWLEYDTGCTGFIEWKKVDREELRELVGQGELDLEILEDGECVDWLRT